MKKLTVLNTSILTSFGSFSYKEINLEEVKKIVADCDCVESALGHQSTVDVVNSLLNDSLKEPLEMNRIQYAQQTGDVALIFKLNGRAPEGVILTQEEIEDMGYSFGLLERQ